MTVFERGEMGWVAEARMSASRSGETWRARVLWTGTASLVALALLAGLIEVVSDAAMRARAAQGLAVAAAIMLAAIAPAGGAHAVAAFAAGRQDPRLNRPLRRPGATPVSGMRGFWGLVTAYWTSERWLEAWTLTAAVIGLTTLLSKASVWVAMASADFLHALVNVHAAEAGNDPLGWVLGAAGIYAAIALARIGGVALRHFA
ncbi:MAG: hypothetical protein AAFU72_16745, partial [Pseudomonadota bacterium]